MILEVVLPNYSVKKVSEIEKVINGEVHTRESIVVAHKGLVYRECHKLKAYAKRVGQDYEDIVSVGFIGLIKAFDRFDGDTYEVRFATYAVPMIWGEIQRMLRDSGTGVYYPRTIKELGWKIRKSELEESSVDVIAEKLETDRSKVIHALDFLCYGVPGSLDQPIRADESESSVADFVGKPDDQTEILVGEFIDSLCERDKQIVEMLLDGQTQIVIGEKIGFTQVHVSRLIKKIGAKYIAYQKGEMNSPQHKEMHTKEVRTLTDKRLPEITEEAVNRMKDSGMTYAAIAEHFGISAPTLANRRQNWELERIRAQYNEKKKAESSPVRTLPVSNENEINELKADLLEKDEFIQKQWKTIDKLTAERDELASQKEAAKSWIDEMKNERRLLALLLEREAERIKSLLEVS